MSLAILTPSAKPSNRTRTARLVSLLLASFIGMAQVTTAQQSVAKPVFTDGQAQVVPAFSNSSEWIREHLWVETEFDSDKNGKKDRVHVDVTRQKQTDTEGLKVPVIYESSPYFAGTANGGAILWDVKHELGAEPPARTFHPDIRLEPNRTMISNELVGTWVPRG
ncbi:MAG: hypothetical protein LW628_06380, partial [Fimbriimonadaceae bacterium]|nr:hypothetical protein [Fimbriimonadaceae bacterium]